MSLARRGFSRAPRYDRVSVSVAELTRNAVHVLPEGALEEKLREGRPLRVKLGIDVTAPDVTLGNGIPLQRMAAFQRAGHTGVLIVGDYTTRIGDPSGRSAARPILSDEEIDRNAQRFVDQASTIIDPARTEVRFNGEWLAKLDFAEVLRLTRTTTVAQILERDDFAKRQRAREPISVSELLYPLMQAYDSVAVRADVELGGTDQLYNLLAGRDVMQAYGLEPQVALTVEYLVSWDGDGMSASRGNYIGLGEAPEEQFGKAMRIPDDLLPQWYRLVMESDADPLAGDPMGAKLALARWIVRRGHGPEAAVRAEEHFTRVVREGRAPDDVPVTPLPPGDPVHLPALLASCFGISSSEARRLIAQGGVRVGDAVVGELDVARPRLVGQVLQGGKRRFVRLEGP
jgi:tyrosyl-tRNA synthetase